MRWITRRSIRKTHACGRVGGGLHELHNWSVCVAILMASIFKETFCSQIRLSCLGEGVVEHGVLTNPLRILKCTR